MGAKAQLPERKTQNNYNSAALFYQSNWRRRDDKPGQLSRNGSAPTENREKRLRQIRRRRRETERPPLEQRVHEAQSGSHLRQNENGTERKKPPRGMHLKKYVRG